MSTTVLSINTMNAHNHGHTCAGLRRRGGRATLLCLLASLTFPTVFAEDAIAVSRAGDELIVRLDRFDLLRQAHSGLNAALRLRGDGKDKELLIDLTDAAVQGALVIDLAQFGRCDGITVTVKDGGGKAIAEKTSAPIPEIVVRSNLTPTDIGKPAKGETYAYIEPGTEMRKARGLPQAAPTERAPAAPRILLPEVPQLRHVKLTQPKRLVPKKEITFPVVADVDFPLVGGSVVGRQTAAPSDPGKASVYFTYKKGIYDGSTLSRWQKFLVEVPIQNSWGAGQGDDSLVLTPDQFEVHITNEAAPGGRNMLGAGDGDLGQKGESDTDEQGRIYWRVEGGGADVVRFNPHTRKFEQPPGRLDFQRFVPKGTGLLNDALCKVTCTRGRVFFTMCNHCCPDISRTKTTGYSNTAPFPGRVFLQVVAVYRLSRIGGRSGFAGAGGDRGRPRGVS